MPDSIQAQIQQLVEHGKTLQISIADSRAEHVEIITKLVHEAAEAIDELKKNSEQIGQRAEAAARQIVGEQVRSGLKNADSIIRQAADNAVFSVTENLRERADRAEAASAALDSAGKKFSGRALSAGVAMMLLVAIGIFGCMYVFTLSMISRDRAAVSLLDAEKAGLQNEISVLRNEISDMAKNAERLREAGQSLSLETCSGHICAAVEPNTTAFGTPSAPYYILRLKQ